MSSSHLDRKELKQPDAFVEKTTKIFHFIENKIKVIGTILVLTILVITAIFLYRNHLDDLELQAQGKLYPVKKAFTENLSKINKTETDWVTKSEKDIQALEKVAVELNKSYAAHEAYMTLGSAFYERSSFEKAAEYFQKAANTTDKILLQMAANMQAGYAFENLKKYDKAIEVFTKIVNNNEMKALRSEALVNLARNYELSGDKTKALENYEKFKKEFPNSQTAKNVDAFISNLKNKK